MVMHMMYLHGVSFRVKCRRMMMVYDLIVNPFGSQGENKTYSLKFCKFCKNITLFTKGK